MHEIYKMTHNLDIYSSWRLIEYYSMIYVIYRLSWLLLLSITIDDGIFCLYEGDIKHPTFFYNLFES